TALLEMKKHSSRSQIKDRQLRAGRPMGATACGWKAVGATGTTPAFQVPAQESTTRCGSASTMAAPSVWTASAVLWCPTSINAAKSTDSYAAERRLQGTDVNS